MHLDARIKETVAALVVARKLPYKRIIAVLYPRHEVLFVPFSIVQKATNPFLLSLTN